MKLKLACADFTFPLLMHERSLALVAMLGFQGVDIGLFEERGHLWPSRELKSIGKSAANLKIKLTDSGLKLADMFLQTAPDFASLAPNHPETAVRRRARSIFQRTLEYTVKAGGRHVTALPGVRFPGESLDVSLGRCSEELAWRGAEAKKIGLIFSIEAHLGSIVPTPALTLRLLKMTPGLTLTLDYGHFVYQGFTGSQIEALIPYASHFHARCGRKKRLQASFKNNAINFSRVLQAMKQIGYRDWIGVEYVWIDWEHCNEVDNVAETILLRDFLKKEFRIHA
jgi:sugar phosphate isomerase/epimerase